MGYFLITLTSFMIDQIFKNKFDKELEYNKEKPIFKNQIILKLYHNEGAFLGILEKKKGLLLLLNIVCLIVLFGLSITYFLIQGERLVKVGLAFITGGALSNIYDRIRRKKVVDYFSFKIKPNIVFNLADMFVFLGGILIIIKSIFFSKQ